MTSSNGTGPTYCPSCGSPASRGRRGARRTVTVLFVDIVGFTSLIEELDCEVVRALQTDYFAAVSAIVRAHGGVVEKYVGDAVMAVFGAHHRSGQGPADLGRLACAAVGAGMTVQQALRGRLLAERFQVHTRVGVATGEAIVDCVATHDGGQDMISGNVVATAARLQAYAPHDTVVVCAATHRLTHGGIAYQDLPPACVAGRPLPLQLWRALHRRHGTGPQPAPRILHGSHC